MLNNEQILQRGLTDANSAPISTTYSLQEMQELELIKTPKDVPLFTRLMAKGAVPTDSKKFEWVETEMESDLTTGLYDGYDVSGVSEDKATPDTADNYLMAYCSIARVGGLVQSLRIVGGDALRVETQHAFIQLIRGIEYYLWNGDHTDPLETNGVATLVTTSVDNVSGVLKENKFVTAIVQMAEKGLTPTHAFTQHMIAQQIANFAEDRIRYDSVNNTTNGVGQRALYYTSPFGFEVEIVPTLTTYISSGTIYVLDLDLITLRYSDDEVYSAKPLAESNDGTAILMKSYFGLELKRADDHIKIINIEPALPTS